MLSHSKGVTMGIHVEYHYILSIYYHRLDKMVDPAAVPPTLTDANVASTSLRDSEGQCITMSWIKR